MEFSPDEKDLIATWLHHPTTGIVFRELRKDFQSANEATCLGATADESHSNAAFREGQREVYNSVLNILEE